MTRLLRIPASVALSIVALAASLSLGGCKDDPGPGDLRVPYRLGNDLSCSSQEVESIRITLNPGAEDIVAEAACGGGEVLVDRVDPGRYFMLVEAIDAEGFAVMDNALDVELPRVEVLGDSEVEAPTQTLSTTPVGLEIAVDFAASSCTASGIAEFEVTTFDDSETEVLLSATLPCDDAIAGYRKIEDPDRDLRPGTFGAVRVQALDGDGAEVGAAIVQTFTPPKAGRTIKLLLEDCDATGCPSSSLN